MLEVEIRDDGIGVADGYVPGRGLRGIAERTHEFGGSVEHGAGERGGFRLRALLPIPGGPATAVAAVESAAVGSAVAESTATAVAAPW